MASGGIFDGKRWQLGCGRGGWFAPLQATWRWWRQFDTRWAPWLAIKVPWPSLKTYPFFSHRQSESGKKCFCGHCHWCTGWLQACFDHCLMTVNVKQKQEGRGTTQYWPSWKNMVKWSRHYAIVSFFPAFNIWDIFQRKGSRIIFVSGSSAVWCDSKDSCRLSRSGGVDSASKAVDWFGWSIYVGRQVVNSQPICAWIRLVDMSHICRCRCRCHVRVWESHISDAIFPWMDGWFGWFW